MDLKVTTTFDISSYLLFEATGDSEAEAQISDDAHDYALALSDDDAQSCCYDQSEAHNVGEEVINGYVSYDEPDDDDEMKEDSNEHENGNKEACVYGTSYYIEEEDDDDDEIQQHHKSTNKPVDSVDEIEKNRRFWEDCLAS